MSSSLVIVAIPAADDYVWKISSQKVPHLTLLFLGDAEKNDKMADIVQFVEHAVSVCEHGPFMLGMDYRGTLGKDNADVIFFEKDWSFDWIEHFRSQLLQNGSIREAFETSDQFLRKTDDAPDQYAEWNPHLTLGYPDSPAKETDSDQDQRLHWVSFDRIAVWTDDFDGPEFRLKWPERFLDSRSGEVGWSGTAGLTKEKIPLEDAVAQATELGEEVITHVSEKAWSDFTKADYTPEQWHAACLIHLHEGDPTSKSQCKLPVKTPNGALNRNGVHAAAAALAGARGGVDAPEEEKKKAAAALRRYYSQLDEEPPESLAQTAVDLGIQWLEHYGIKGMRWGVRQQRSVETKAHVDTGLFRRQTRVQAKGGEAHPAHEDAVVAAVQKQKLKKSGTDALSTRELQQLAGRLELEARVETLATKKGKRFVSRQIEQQGQQQIQRGIGKGISKAGPHVIRKSGKAAATGLATAALL